MDLPRIDGTGLAPEELQPLIAGRVAEVPGGIANQVVRLVVTGVPRHVARQLDHAAIRGWKAEALHFQLDLRRPEPTRTTGVGCPGRRQTLPDLVSEYLGRRALPAGVDREAFVREGRELVEAAERELVED